jgi:hypothetical protein
LSRDGFAGGAIDPGSTPLWTGGFPRPAVLLLAIAVLIMFWSASTTAKGISSAAARAFAAFKFTAAGNVEVALSMVGFVTDTFSFVVVGKAGGTFSVGFGFFSSKAGGTFSVGFGFFSSKAKAFVLSFWPWTLFSPGQRRAAR